MSNLIRKNKLQISDTVLMLLGLLLGLLFSTFNIIGFNFEYFPGDLGDGRLNLYFLEHAYKFFTGKISSFWNAPFMYPETNVMAFSDNLLGSAPIYSLFRLIGFDIYLSYQLWFIALSALNYISAYYFLKFLFKNKYAAVLGAFVFAFSLALQSQLTHAQTFPRFAIPLAFLMAVKFGKDLKLKYLFYTLLFVVYQIYCGIYLGFMLAVPVGIYLILVIVSDVRYDKKVIYNRKWFFQLAAYGLINILLLLPLLLPYLERNIAPSFARFKQLSHSIPTIRSHLFSQHGSLIWDFLSKTGQNYQAWWDHQIFAGGVATISLLIAVYCLLFHFIKTKFRLDHISSPLRLMLAAVITFLLYIRVKGVSAYIALYFLPGFSALRSLTRIINIELIFFAIATAFVFTRFFNYNIKYKWILFLLALSITVCDNYFYANNSYKTEVSVAKERTDRIERTFARIPAGSVISYEPVKLESPSIFYQLDAMLTSQKHELITLNGYSASCPGDFGMYWNDPNEKTRNYFLGGRNFTHDTLYVVKSQDIVEKVPVREIQNFNLNSAQLDGLQSLINYFRTKALQKDCPK